MMKFIRHEGSKHAVYRNIQYNQFKKIKKYYIRIIIIIIGPSGTGFYGSNDPTNSVKALNEDRF